MSYDKWKLSNPIDDGYGRSTVSQCCGASFEEEVGTCAECGSLDIGEVTAGDEGWTVCNDCQAIEQGYDYVNICEKCDEPCEEIDEYEYDEIQRENYLEQMADGRRDEGY